MQDAEPKRMRQKLSSPTQGITSSRLLFRGTSAQLGGLLMMVTLISSIASFPALVHGAAGTAGGRGVGEPIVSPIMIQPRQPLPPHKLRMLLGPEDSEEVRRKLADPQAELPLHAGYGTHFAYLYVGTPPQRVSVILDTGSHWTAFPCTGCK